MYGRAPDEVYFVIAHREVWKDDCLLGEIPDERIASDGIYCEADLRRWLARWKIPGTVP